MSVGVSADGATHHGVGVDTAGRRGLAVLDAVDQVAGASEAGLKWLQ